jgi:large subunit ribosomal protein L22
MADIEVLSTAKHLRLSPRKVRLVVDLVRGKQVDEALGILKMSAKGSADDVAKVI